MIAGFLQSPMTSSKWSATLPDRLVGEHPGAGLGLLDRLGVSGQCGDTAVYPFFSKSFAHRSQLLGRSQSPWTNTTGTRPAAFARSTCSASCSVTVVTASSFFFAIDLPFPHRVRG